MAHFSADIHSFIIPNSLMLADQSMVLLFPTERSPEHLEFLLHAVDAF